MTLSSSSKRKFQMKVFSREEVAPLKRLIGWLLQNQTGTVLLPLLGSAVSILFEKATLVYFTAAIRLRFFQIPAAGPEVAPKHSFLVAVSLLRTDMLYSFVLIPSIFCLLTGKILPLWRTTIATCFAFCVQALVVMEMFSYLLSDAFSSLLLMWFSVYWEIKTHQFAYSAHRFFSVLTFLDFVFVVLLGILALIAVKRKWRWLNQAVLVAFGVGAAVVALAYISGWRATAWSQPLLQLTVGPTLSDIDTSLGLDRRSAPELLNAYRELTHVPAPHETAYTGKAKNYNVVFFVLEAITAEAFDPVRDSLNDTPNVRDIRENSFVMVRHYTSYPMTDNATFSIFTSLYEGQDQEFLKRQVELPSVIRTLRNRGYATEFAGFVWDDVTHNDYPLLTSLGFEKFAAPPNGIGASNLTFGGPVDYVEKNDHNSLLALLADIHNWTAQGQRFAAAFFPEMGHDPYRAVGANAARPESALQRGHDLMVYQDAWLGELLAELKRDGALQNTILVFTSDHGMRLMAGPGGHPPFYIAFHSTLDDTMLRVPMLIYLPGVLEHPVFIDGPTSHIDIAPTVLDLLGISAGREMELGLPVYDPGIARRRLFLDMGMYGASGFYSDGTYDSCSTIGVVYESHTLDFNTHDQVPYDSREAENVRRIMKTRDTNQNALLNLVLTGQ